MKDQRNILWDFLGFIGLVVLIELLLTILAVYYFRWAWLCLVVLAAVIQAATLLLVWYVLRMVLRINDRIRHIEADGLKKSP